MSKTRLYGADIRTLIGELDANAQRADVLVSRLSGAQFNWRAEPGRWSIAQCLGHLNTVNGGDTGALQASIAAGRAAGITGTGPFRYGVISRRFVASMEPPVTRKFKAPKAYQPPPEGDPNKVLAEYRQLSRELRGLMEAAAGLDLARVKTTLPALPPVLRAIVRMPLGARLALLTTHDRRHLWQAAQVREHAAFPVR